MISLAGLILGLNVGVQADTAAEAQIDVEEQVAEIDANTARQPPDNPAVPPRLEDPILTDVSLIPEPYASRLDAALESWTLSIAKKGVRYGLTVADKAAGFAYANQSLLTTTGVLWTIRTAISAAILAPAGYYSYRIAKIGGQVHAG